MLSDLRYALRQLHKSPLFTATALLTLALGIGATTAIFTLVQNILLRSLPVASPQQLYRVGEGDDCCVNGGFSNNDGNFDIFSYELYQVLQAASKPEFRSLAAVSAGAHRFPVRRGTALAASLSGQLVSGNYFSTLGIRAFAGRLLTPADDRPGAGAVAVLSYVAWQNEFGGDRHIVGETISVESHPFVVVGIAPPGFYGGRVSASPPAVWVPLRAQPVIWGQTDPSATLLTLPGENWLYLVGRVQAGANIGAAQAKLSATLRHWLSTQAQYTRNGGAALIPKQHVTIVSAAGGVQTLQQETGSGLKLLLALVGVLLLIACANVANMMLARATARRGEISLRLALGESRARLLRRMLSESVLLACLGGLAGLAVAYAGARVILALAFPDAVHSSMSAAPSLPVLGFAFGVSLLTGILFGLAPAWAASRAQPAEALRGANRSTRDRSSLSQHALVVFQVALSLVLVAGALITARSLANVERQNFGVTTAQRYVVHWNESGAGYTTATVAALNRRIEDAFTALPGVAHVGLGIYSPLEDNNWGQCVIQQGHPAPGPNDRCGSSFDRVSAGFLASIGVPILQGRGFTAQDTATAPQVALVNQTFAKQFFPHQNPIGQHFGLNYPEYSGAFEIVGVFRDFKLNQPRHAVRPVFLLAMTQHYSGYKQPSMQSIADQSMFMNSMVVAFAHPPASAPALLRHTLAGIDPNLIISDLRTFQNQVSGNFSQDRLLATLAGLFGVLALILASIGLYGVTAYLVARRTSEIGVRMALGASRGRIVRMVLRGVGVQALIGLAVGIPAAMLTARLMTSQMYGVGPYDPRALVGGAIVLIACALAAGLIPARRAAMIEPARTLKAE